MNILSNEDFHKLLNEEAFNSNKIDDFGRLIQLKKGLSGNINCASHDSGEMADIMYSTNNSLGQYSNQNVLQNVGSGNQKYGMSDFGKFKSGGTGGTGLNYSGGGGGSQWQLHNNDYAQENEGSTNSDMKIMIGSENYSNYNNSIHKIFENTSNNMAGGVRDSKEKDHSDTFGNQNFAIPKSFDVGNDSKKCNVGSATC